ncbi:unnamed protein product [Linum trigynum]|uniref:Uncharacterized protein n=1 Tax=Linum trigynum TaxID=586398 RepID=A0AAV2GMU6_9ROSI
MRAAKREDAARKLLPQGLAIGATSTSATTIIGAPSSSASSRAVARPVKAVVEILEQQQPVVITAELSRKEAPPLPVMADEVVMTTVMGVATGLLKEDQGKVARTTVPEVFEEKEGPVGEILVDRQPPRTPLQIASRSPPTSDVAPASVQVASISTPVQFNPPIDRWKFRKKQQGPRDGFDGGQKAHGKAPLTEGEEAERLVRRAESVLDKEAARSKAPHSPSTATTAKEVEEVVSEPISPSAAIPNIITITDEQSNHGAAVAVLPSSIAKEEVQEAEITREQQLLPTSTSTLDHLALPASPTTVAAASRTAITSVVAAESFAEKIESNLKVEEVLQVNLKEAEPLIGNLLVKSSRFNWKFRKKLKPDEVEPATDASSITVASSASSPIRPQVSAKEKAPSISKLEATALSTDGTARMTGANRELEGEAMKGSRVVSPRSRATRGCKEDSAKLSIEKKQRRRGMASDFPGIRLVDGALEEKMPPGVGPSREKKTSRAAGRVGQEEESRKESGDSVLRTSSIRIEQLGRA